MTRTTQTRRGVTLVEMLVATALCIAGMWMLTWMFQQATDSFSLANAQAGLTGQQRMVTQVIERDFKGDRFTEDDTRPNRGVRLSDILVGSPRPRAGYFWARSRPTDGTINILEGGGTGAPDSYGFYSSRSADHFLSFTSILPDSPGNRFYATIRTPSGQQYFAGSAVELSYFLVPTGTSSTGAQLYDLMRVQRIVALSTYDAADYQRMAVAPGYTAGDAVHEVMVAANGAPPQMYTLANLATVTGPAFPRFVPGTTRAVTSTRYGEDRLMSNVLSFEVKFTGERANLNGPNPWPPASNSPNEWPRRFAPDPTTPPGYLGNSDFPFDNLPYDGQLDSAAPNGVTGSPRQPLRVTAAQIRIRSLSGTVARQTTIVVNP